MRPQRRSEDDGNKPCMLIIGKTPVQATDSQPTLGVLTSAEVATKAVPGPAERTDR